MTPKELRAFRESLGLSRREFAPKVFISEPTLERWERGQGGPREIHLHILRRMRDHLGAGHSISYFQYDADATVPISDLPHDEKQTIIETLRGMAAVVLEETEGQNDRDWSVRFGLGWAVGEPIDVALRCEGSERPERPTIDFSLEITAEGQDVDDVFGRLQPICFRHGLSWNVESEEHDRLTVALRQRIFTTGCNPETIRHVIGNYHSCWQLVKAALVSPGVGCTPEQCVEPMHSSS